MLQYTKSNQCNMPLFKEVHRSPKKTPMCSFEDKINNLHSFCTSEKNIYKGCNPNIYRTLQEKNDVKIISNEKLTTCVTSTFPLVALVSMTWVRPHSLWVISPNMDRKNIAFGADVSKGKIQSLPFTFYNPTPISSVS